MPSNLELVKRIFLGWEEGDWGWIDWADPDIHFEMIGGLTEGRWKGRQEMSDAWGALKQDRAEAGATLGRPGAGPAVGWCYRAPGRRAR